VKQKNLFLEGEGDRWFDRNRGVLVKPIDDDPVCLAMVLTGMKPKRVAEIGCANGWRLALLRERYGCDIIGVEPSMEACIDAAATYRVPVVQSTASNPALSPPFDVLIYGFCLYLTDPADWLQIAAEGNALLSPGGHLIIHDFAPTSLLPHARRYEHRSGILSYHYDFSELWLGCPLYSLVNRYVTETDSVTVLKKLPVSSIKVVP
jgi:SAM-dependent methyltransferase